MIDNVVLLISGTLHERDTHELLERCHPLGTFETMPALCVATNVEELYSTVLVETPLGECADQGAGNFRQPADLAAWQSSLLPRLPFSPGSRRAEYRDYSEHRE